ncbi:MAG: MFS transporter [Planctomycetota bacterium]
MSLSLRIRLSAMMFLQYAIWGAWAPVLAAHLKGLGFTGCQIGWVYGVLWLSCIVAPFVGGQIADRWFPTQWFLAVVHLAGGFFLLYAAKQTGFRGMVTIMALYSLLYAPTLALTNSLAFHHLKDAEKQFGIIRVFGTIGWIVAGFALTFWRTQATKDGGAAVSGDTLLLAGWCSIAMGIFCCFLPHTPPKKQAENPWAFMEALQLLKDKNFAVFMGIAFVVTTELQFYYIPTAEFLEKGVGILQKNVPAVMTTAQIAEIIAMALFLPLLLPRIGMRKALAIGVIAWPLRYVVFALYKNVPYEVVVGSLTLHGIGYTFFFVVSQIYVNKVAPPDIRASAQALLTLITLGVGSFIGTQFTGVILDVFSTPEGRHWPTIFLIPCALTVACAVAFLIWFREPQSEAPSENAPAESEKSE